MLRTGDYSPGYGAPEIINQDSDQESSEYTSAVDLWGLGVTVFRLLAAELPFPNNHAVVKYVRGRFAFPSGILDRKEVSRNAFTFISRLLTADPAYRPPADLALKHGWFGKHHESEAKFLSARIPRQGIPRIQPDVLDPLQSTIAHLKIEDPNTNQQRGQQIDNDVAVTKPETNLSKTLAAAKLTTAGERVSPSTHRPQQKPYAPVQVSVLASTQPHKLNPVPFMAAAYDLWDLYPSTAAVLRDRDGSTEGLALQGGMKDLYCGGR